MNIAGIISWVFENVIKRALDLLGKKYPKYDQIGNYVEAATEIALDIVIAAQATGLDNATKKKKAVDDLTKAMAGLGVGDGKKIDLPGDLEHQIAGAVIEGALEAWKKYMGK